jgi:hypothetical protein
MRHYVLKILQIIAFIFSLQRQNSLKSNQKSTTSWYGNTQTVDGLDEDYYDEDEIEQFDQKASKNATKNVKNSRHSLETDEDESCSDPESVESVDGFPSGGSTRFLKLFHSTPSLNKSNKNLRGINKTAYLPIIRPRAPTNEKLEKYKFLLVNIVLIVR